MNSINEYSSSCSKFSAISRNTRGAINSDVVEIDTHEIDSVKNREISRYGDRHSRITNRVQKIAKRRSIAKVNQRSYATKIIDSGVSRFSRMMTSRFLSEDRLAILSRRLLHSCFVKTAPRFFCESSSAILLRRQLRNSFVRITPQYFCEDHFFKTLSRI